MRMVTYGRQGGRGSGGSDENKLNKQKEEPQEGGKDFLRTKSTKHKGKD